MRLQRFDAPAIDYPGAAGQVYVFWCPGCQCHHTFNVGRERHPVWTFDGNMETPTFSPSLHYVGRCHLFLREGKLQFLPDCNHKLAGQTVDLPEIPPEHRWGEV